MKEIKQDGIDAEIKHFLDIANKATENRIIEMRNTDDCMASDISRLASMRDNLLRVDFSRNDMSDAEKACEFLSAVNQFIGHERLPGGSSSLEEAIRDIRFDILKCDDSETEGIQELMEYCNAVASTYAPGVEPMQKRCAHCCDVYSVYTVTNDRKRFKDTHTNAVVEFSLLSGMCDLCWQKTFKK